MTIKSFLKLVEIQTKVASVFPMSIGILLASYQYREINLRNTFLMIISLLFIDMTTTAINNFMDYKKAKKKYGYNYEIHNAIVQFDLKEKQVITTILIMLIIASISGILLFINTDIVILLLGIISFGVGIFYSFGPVPISRTPFGEIFSGVFMGFIILFIAFYINTPVSIINIEIIKKQLLLSIDYLLFIKILIAAIPLVISIGNIMLANNICDLDEDITNDRYTLVYFLGKKRALKLFKNLYIFAFIFTILTIYIWEFSLLTSIFLLGYIIIYLNTKKFLKKQTKADTFKYAVMNHLLISFIIIVIII
ncbi:MAG: 1,4-dihydroxy-2-naphthoate polyprenyltransferase, partial [Bacillota bacterium]